MKSPNQKQVWDNIAEEWFEFKKEPSDKTIEFLKKQQGNILDLGSGSGRHLTKIKNGKMYLVDFSKEMIKLAKKNAKQKNIDAEFKIAPMTKSPFKDNFFDSAIFINALHCIDSKEKRETSLKEFFRVLKPKSQALIIVWNKDSKRFKNSPKERHVKWRNKGKRYYYLYNEKELHDLFKKTGFKIKKKFPPNITISFIAEKI